MTTPFIDTVVDAFVYLTIAVGVASFLFFMFYAAREHIRYHREARPRLRVRLRCEKAGEFDGRG
jgi:hypothetical protein